MYVLERRIVYAFTFTQMLYWCLFINRAITLEWAHKHFVLSVYTFFISTKVFRNVVCSWWLFWARLNVFNGKRRLQPAVRNKQKRQNNDWVPRRTGIVHTSSIQDERHDAGPLLHNDLNHSFFQPENPTQTFFYYCNLWENIILVGKKSC